MHKFEGIKKVAGYDSDEVRDSGRIDIRKDIRDRTKFPVEIQDILSQSDKLFMEEEHVKSEIQKIEENMETVNYDLLRELKEKLEKINEQETKLYTSAQKILDGKPELAAQFQEYLSIKADKEKPEEVEFSQN